MKLHNYYRLLYIVAGHHIIGIAWTGQECSQFMDDLFKYISEDFTHENLLGPTYITFIGNQYFWINLFLYLAHELILKVQFNYFTNKYNYLFIYSHILFLNSWTQTFIGKLDNVGLKLAWIIFKSFSFCWRFL